MSAIKLRLALSGPYIFWHIFSILVAGIMTAIAGFIAFFIYQSMYAALSNAVVIEALSPSANLYVVDLPKFSKTQALLEKKGEPIAIPPNLRNIFAFQEESSSYATSSKK